MHTGRVFFFLAPSLSLHTLRMVHWIPSNNNSNDTAHKDRLLSQKREKGREESVFWKNFFLLCVEEHWKESSFFVLSRISGLQESCFCCSSSRCLFTSFLVLRSSLSLSREILFQRMSFFRRKKFNFLFVIYQKKMFF